MYFDPPPPPRARARRRRRVCVFVHTSSVGVHVSMGVSCVLTGGLIGRAGGCVSGGCRRGGGRVGGLGRRRCRLRHLRLGFGRGGGAKVTEYTLGLRRELPHVDGCPLHELLSCYVCRIRLTLQA